MSLESRTQAVLQKFWTDRQTDVSSLLGGTIRVAFEGPGLGVTSQPRRYVSRGSMTPTAFHSRKEVEAIDFPAPHHISLGPADWSLEQM